MNQFLPTETKEITEGVYNLPSVSIIVPFEPKMVSKGTLMSTIQSAVDRVEREVVENYTYDMSSLVMHKLNTIIKQLDFSTHKRSLAIYVSPVWEKVLYLNQQVEESINVSDSFHIRDLIKSKKVLHQYLLLQIGSNEIHMYFNDSGKMERIFSSNLRAISKIPVPFWTQSGMADSRRTEENDNVKSLRKVDNTLDHILASYSLPFFVTGKKKVIDEFRQITKHTYAITEYAPHTSDDPDKEELKKIIAPYVADWEKINQKRLMGLVYRATEKHKLVSGIVDVYKTTKYNNGKLLLVEEDYVYPDTYTESDEMIYQATKSYSPYSYLKDAVDEAIEKVLEEDGDVGYMQKGALANYEHITLIQ